MVFVLIHKMDLISDKRKKEVYEKRQKEIAERCKNFPLKCFPTSIWEFSLYKAWTEIVSSLVMDMNLLKSSLNKLAEACSAEEVILFEKSSFLLTCHYAVKENPDDQRFEKISHIIKKFKLSCLNSKSHFDGITIKTKHYTFYLKEFTKSTYIMMIFENDNSNIQELVKLNLDISKKAFESIIDKITC
jgi:Ras-related GTP-binding protein A/B